MLNIRRWLPGMAGLLTVCLAVAGCAPKTNVSATGNVPAQFSHVFLSVHEIWFNKSATAGPDDTTWSKFPLTTPVTIDLASSLSGTLNTLTTGLAVPTATYAQVRLIPVDAGTTLLSTAQSLGAIFNSEVDYVDTAKVAHQSPLELQNPDRGLGIQTTLTIKASSSNSFGAAGNNSTTTGTSSTSTNTSDPFLMATVDSGTTGATTGTTTGTPIFSPGTTGTAGTTGTTTTGTTTPSITSTGTDTSTTGVSTTTSTIAPFTMAINVDGARDLVPFSYTSVPGVLLNPHPGAYDASTVGAVTGTLTVSGLTGVASVNTTSSYLNIQVTAESLSADGTRHQAVNSTAVRSDGTFTLYPLSSSTSTPTSYDLVIHGPGIATIIVKGVSITAGDPSSTTPVSIGTVTPRAASPFAVNLATTTPLQAGAIVGFYQTLPGSGEVPYLVEQAPIDPFNRNLANNVMLSPETIDYGTLSSGTAALTAATPSEGASTYRASATAPLYSDGALTATISGPAASSSNASLVAVPTLTVASGASSDSAAISVSEVTPGKYNAGQLIISHDGAIVATAALDTLLARGNGGTLTISGIPGGSSASRFDSGLYYVSVRTWNTSNPASTLNREIYPTALDLRSGSVTGFSLSID